MRLRDFAGSWDLDRQIDDRRAGTWATFAGQAEFLAQDGGLRYHETGVLHLPGVAPIKAERIYHWHGDGADVAVTFEDGRPFHTVSLSDPAPQARHWCDPDIYDVAYGFEDWPVWTSQWRVAGPRKDYVMISTYRRI